MQMTPKEIVRNYREAKNKKMQIGILAELNLCSKQDILDILKQEGLPHRELPRTRKESSVSSKTKKEPVKKEITEAAVERKREEIPEAVKEAITKQMIEEQEAIDKHTAKLKELNEYLTGGAE